MGKKKKKLVEKLPSALGTFFDAFQPDAIPSDVEGSYTGNPAQGAVPVQDADDL